MTLIQRQTMKIDGWIISSFFLFCLFVPRRKKVLIRLKIMISLSISLQGTCGNILGFHDDFSILYIFMHKQMIHFSCYMIPTWKIESNIRKYSRKQGRSKLLLLNKWTEKTTLKTWSKGIWCHFRQQHNSNQRAAKLNIHFFFFLFFYTQQ